jgi:hypothetical protein
VFLDHVRATARIAQELLELGAAAEGGIIGWQWYHTTSLGITVHGLEWPMDLHLDRPLSR